MWGQFNKYSVLSLLMPVCVVASFTVWTLAANVVAPQSGFWFPAVERFLKQVTYINLPPQPPASVDESRRPHLAVRGYSGTSLALPASPSSSAERSGCDPHLKWTRSAVCLLSLELKAPLMAGESLKVVVLFTTRIIGAVAIGDVRTSWRREAGVVVTYGVCTLCKLGSSGTGMLYNSV